MVTFEKGQSYDFPVKEIVKTNNNSYYIIQVDKEKCWIKMYPFEIHQNPSKRIIRCEYRGLDSYKSHIFIEDKLSILHDLYKGKEICNFSYVKEGIDTSGYSFSVLKDKYELLHRIYEPLSEEQKNGEKPIICFVSSIDKIRKALTLHVIEKVDANYQVWISAEELFKAIDKEELLNEYFHGINIYRQYVGNIFNLYQTKNNKWIIHYLKFLDKRYKYVLIQKKDLHKITEFADLMISLINWMITSQMNKSKKIPKLNKYEGLRKAIEILQNNYLYSYKENFLRTENLIPEMSTLFSLFEIDPSFFNENFSFYKEITEKLYKNLLNSNTLTESSKDTKEKCINALLGIISNRIKIEYKRIINNILPEDDLLNQIKKMERRKTFNLLYSILTKYPNSINNQDIHSYIDMQPQALSAILCIIYGLKQLGEIENPSKLLNEIRNIFYFSNKYGQENNKNKDFEDMEENAPSNEQQISDEFKKKSDEDCFHLNLYKDGTYVITEKKISESSIIRSITINPNIDKFILQCYEHGSVNKVPVRILLEKKKEKKYLNGCYSQDCLKDIYIISEETYIATISSYNNNTFIKLYSTEYISEHLSLSLKGNQVVGAIVDSTEYFLISPEHTTDLPNRLIYNSPTPLGKNIQNSYYENDIVMLERLGILTI